MTKYREILRLSALGISQANIAYSCSVSKKTVNIRPDTMNIDEKLIEGAITGRTKAIVPVHYAGVSCEMDMIMDIAERHGLKVIEDAAQGISSTYKGKSLGTIGDFGCFSFHETKNLSMGEGDHFLYATWKTWKELRSYVRRALTGVNSSEDR